MKAELIGPDAPVWEEILQRAPHDFHHTAGYLRHSAQHEGGTARAMVVEDGVSGLFLPVVIRPIWDGSIDAASPYGYPGPIMWGTTEPEFMREALETGIDLLRSEGIVSLFVRLHPILNAVAPVGVGTVVTHGETVSVDLTQPSDMIWGRTRKNHRRDILKAVSLGYVARLDSSWEHFDTFVRQYRETMGRLGAEERYMFDEAYFRGLRSALGSSISLWVVQNGAGVVAASVLFVETAGIVQYHLAGSDEEFAQDRPNKLLINSARTWAQERRNRHFHLGGGVGAAYDSLMHFKAGFSDDRYTFRTLRVVVAKDEYARLVGERDLEADPAEMQGFFPLYRKA